MPQGRVIDAAPTKDFFIHMLVRDIELIPAIGDLVDNCVDGARRLRRDGPYNGLSVRLAVDSSRFRIEDNCGGIPLEVAEKYAFRFGRPEGMADTPKSIGQFGVGMKRALFKLGSAFRVESRTERESFSVHVDVGAWRRTPEWEFQFETYESDQVHGDAGTIVTVEPLHSDTANSLSQQAFITRLARSIGAHHQRSIAQGLVVTLNGAPVGGGVLELLDAPQLRAATESLQLFTDDPPVVIIRLYVGVANDSNPPDAGWYVYCNGRLVVGADKSSMTGWGAGEESRFPQFHNRYGRFRGYAFFDCDDAGRLPWTTTKTGLNTDSFVYQRALQAMRQVARPVTSFLYELSEEVETPPEDAGTELEAVIRQASPRALDALPPSQRFDYQRAARRQQPPPRVPTQSIQYRKPLADIERAKRALGVQSATEVGQRSFDYFVKRECEA